MTTANDNYILEDTDTQYKGYSLFDNIENKLLQAFNRWNVLSNMTQNGLDHIGLEYLDQLNDTDKLRLALMSEYIKRKGLEETKREIIAKVA